MKRFVALLMLMSGLLVAGGALGAANVYMYESGGNVVVTVSGTLNTSALEGPTSGGFGLGIQPQLPFVNIGGGSNGCDLYSGAGGTTNWGSGGFTSVSSGSGDRFTIVGTSLICLPLGYTGGDLDGTSTFNSTTITNLGLLAGTYLFSWGSGGNADTLTVNVGVSPPAPVPSLSEWTQFLLGLMVMSMIGWYFHKQRSY